MDLFLSKRTSVINHILKNTKPGTHIKPLKYFAFDEDEQLCVISNLNAYPSQDQTTEEAVFTAIDQLCQVKQASCSKHCRKMDQTSVTKGWC